MKDCRNCRHMGNDPKDRCRGCWEEGMWRRWEAAEEASLWIPVTERLPEDGLTEGSDVDEIWCYVTMRDLTYGDNHAMTLYRCKDGRKWGWYSPFYDPISNPITAWLPLPEPYNPEKEATINK